MSARSKPAAAVFAVLFDAGTGGCTGACGWLITELADAAADIAATGALTGGTGVAATAVVGGAAGASARKLSPKDDSRSETRSPRVSFFAAGGAIAGSCGFGFGVATAGAGGAGFSATGCADVSGRKLSPSEDSKSATISFSTPGA